MTVGQRIGELRKGQKIRQKRTAELLDVSVSTVSNYEQGVHLPDYDRLIILSNEFHVSVDYLLGVTDVHARPEVLQEAYTDGLTNGQVLDMLRKLDPASREALIKYLRFLVSESNQTSCERSE